jgi:hypothetical protein
LTCVNHTQPLPTGSEGRPDIQSDGNTVFMQLQTTGAGQSRALSRLDSTGVTRSAQPALRDVDGEIS